MKTEIYKRKLIISNPYHLVEKGFSSNGFIQIHTEKEVLDIKLDVLQSKKFQNENDADIFFIEEAKKLIDQGIV